MYRLGNIGIIVFTLFKSICIYGQEITELRDIARLKTSHYATIGGARFWCQPFRQREKRCCLVNRPELALYDRCIDIVGVPVPIQSLGSGGGGIGARSSIVDGRLLTGLTVKVRPSTNAHPSLFLRSAQIANAPGLPIAAIQQSPDFIAFGEPGAGAGSQSRRNGAIIPPAIGFGGGLPIPNGGTGGLPQAPAPPPIGAFHGHGGGIPRSPLAVAGRGNQLDLLPRFRQFNTAASRLTSFKQANNKIPNTQQLIPMQSSNVGPPSPPRRPQFTPGKSSDTPAGRRQPPGRHFKTKSFTVGRKHQSNSFNNIPRQRIGFKRGNFERTDRDIGRLRSEGGGTSTTLISRQNQQTGPRTIQRRRFEETQRFEAQQIQKAKSARKQFSPPGPHHIDNGPPSVGQQVRRQTPQKNLLSIPLKTKKLTTSIILNPPPRINNFKPRTNRPTVTSQNSSQKAHISDPSAQKRRPKVDIDGLLTDGFDFDKKTKSTSSGDGNREKKVWPPPDHLPLPGRVPCRRPWGCRPDRITPYPKSERRLIRPGAVSVKFNKVGEELLGGTPQKPPVMASQLTSFDSAEFSEEVFLSTNRDIQHTNKPQQFRLRNDRKSLRLAAKQRIGEFGSRGNSVDEDEAKDDDSRKLFGNDHSSFPSKPPQKPSTPPRRTEKNIKFDSSETSAELETFIDSLRSPISVRNPSSLSLSQQHRHRQQIVEERKPDPLKSVFNKNLAKFSAIHPTSTRLVLLPPKSDAEFFENSKCFLNLLFIVDASGSVRTRFQKELELAAQVVDRLTIAGTKSKVGFIKFAGPHKSRVIFGFNDFMDKQKIKSKILSIKHSSGTSHTGKALELANEEFVKEQGRGARPVIIIFTDGFSTKDPAREAMLLHDKDVLIFAVAIDSPRDDLELARIAGHSSRVFTDQSFRQFQRRLDQLTDGC